MKNLKKESLAHNILDYLKNTSVDALDLGIKIIFEPEKIDGLGGLIQFRKYSYAQQLSNLKRSPYFEYKNKVFYVTPQGRLKIIKSIIQDKKNTKVWDRKWRGIIFDIPEANRNERNFLRKELKWIGFKELQHSIWITPYDIEKELLFLLKLWHKDFRGDIRFLMIEKITNDQDFKEIFNL